MGIPLVLVLFGIFNILVSSVAVQKWHTSLDGRQFYIENEHKFSWFGAWNECARKNMSLIAIDDYNKHVQIDTLIRKIFPISPFLWIGGHDNDIADRYEWPMTGEIFTFTNWGTGQPKGGANHCIHIWTDWNWHDAPCINKMGFICEENRYIKECGNRIDGVLEKFNVFMEYIKLKNGGSGKLA